MTHPLYRNATVACLLVVAGVLAGCLGGRAPSGTDEGETANRAYPAGVHPWPRGDEWPAGLTGPFSLREILEVRVPSFDGVELEGWLLFPDLPSDVRAPTVMWSAPYFGQCSYFPSVTPTCSYATGDDPALRDGSSPAEAVPVDLLIEHGYVVAVFNVRGTGNSGGCFEWFGPNEQRDQAFLVEWIAKQTWSNGRVGMMGLSYHGTTPWEAAIQNPEPLKTIVVAGMVSDPYTFSHTPQGAVFTTITLFETHFAWRVSLSPPIGGGPEHATLEHVPVAADRLCPEVVAVVSEEYVGTATDERNAAFWNSRRLIDRFPEITASVFLTHGFQDLWGSGHQQQENAAWGVLLKAPKRMLEGQWGHEFPNFNSFNPDWVMTDWYDRLLPWLDFWLKGVGEAPPGLGVVDYQDGTGVWHASSAWPPAESREEVLYLRGDALSPAAATGDVTFQSLPEPNGPAAQFCPAELGVWPATTGHVFLTQPATERVLVAGNPFAWLHLTSSLPGGLVAVHLYDVGPAFACTDSGPEDVRRWAVGVADLRFHEGNFRGKDFPTGEATHVRIDITDVAEVLEVGHRLAAVVSYGDPIDRTSQPLYPQIQIHDQFAEGSHLVIPTQEGTFGGLAPTIDYAPRPFVPVIP